MIFIWCYSLVSIRHVLTRKIRIAEFGYYQPRLWNSLWETKIILFTGYTTQQPPTPTSNYFNRVHLLAIMLQIFNRKKFLHTKFSWGCSGADWRAVMWYFSWMSLPRDVDFFFFIIYLLSYIFNPNKWVFGLIPRCWILLSLKVSFFSNIDLKSSFVYKAGAFTYFFRT